MQRDQSELVALVDRLRLEPNETEWLEFKGKACAPQEIGEYLSALANSAALKRKLRGYLVFGVENLTHRVVGTSYDAYREKVGNQSLLIWLAVGLDPRVSVNHPDNRPYLGYHGQVLRITLNPEVNNIARQQVLISNGVQVAA